VEAERLADNHAMERVVFLAALLLTACSTAPRPSSNECIGTATMSADGAITLNLRAEGAGGEIGDGAVIYPRDHPQYREVLNHLGGLKTGESKCVPPWLEREGTRS
jgi:hypothetical protein